MSFSTLSHLLITERERSRAAPAGGFSRPIGQFREVPTEVSSILASNTRGAFVQAVRNREGAVGYGFFECPLSEEPVVVTRLHQTVWDLAAANGWPNRASSLEEARAILPSAHTLVIPFGLVEQVCGGTLAPEVLSEVMQAQGYLRVMGELRVMVGQLPDNCMLLAASPPALGVYTRLGDHLGLQLYNVQQTLVVIRTHGVAG